jgi:hypothetical protein
MTDTNNEKGGSPDTDGQLACLDWRGSLRFSRRNIALKIEKISMGGSYESGFCIKHVQRYAV